MRPCCKAEGKQRCEEKNRNYNSSTRAFFSLCRAEGRGREGPGGREGAKPCVHRGLEDGIPDTLRVGVCLDYITCIFQSHYHTRGQRLTSQHSIGQALD